MKYKVEVTRTMTWRNVYEVDAPHTSAAEDMAREKDEQADLDSGALYGIDRDTSIKEWPPEVEDATPQVINLMDALKAALEPRKP